MKRIGVLFGMEHSFPGALVERINRKHPEGVAAEFVSVGAVRLGQPPRYSVIIDRISHEIPFYRAFLRHAALQGAAIVNNPFRCAADDKFFHCGLAGKLGVAIPPTVILPHKQRPGQTTDRSMRNLEFPLDWDSVFAHVGEHGFLKPINGGGWRDVHEVRGREEFFRAYDQSRDLCMMFQKAVNFSEYYRCYVVNRKKVRIMAYDPRRPHAERYLDRLPRGPMARMLLRRIEQDALRLCRALGYDLNSVEFAVEGGIPYAIDFMNPVPDADLHSVGGANFEWIVEQVAEMAIARARKTPQTPEAHVWPLPAAAEREGRPKTRREKRRSGKSAREDRPQDARLPKTGSREQAEDA
jgi:hypothetical protein